ncbi:MAG: O-antigen ligase family protein [bacterium]
MAISNLGRRAVPWLLGLFALFTPFSIAGAHVSLSLALLAALTDPACRAAMARLGRHRLALPLLAWIAVHLLAVAFALDVGGSAEKLKKLALLVLIPLGALPSVRRALRPLLAVLIGSTAVVSVWGLVDHFLHGGGLEARLHGVFGFYMTVAGILMMVGLLCVAQLLAAAKDPHSRRVGFLSGSGLAILVALIATYTRGSWLGFAAGVAWLLRKRWLLLLSLGAVVVAVFVFGAPALRDRAASIVDPNHRLNVERVAIWRTGIDLVKEHPLTGVGLVIPKEEMDREFDTPYGPVKPHSHMHNAYLQIAVAMGLPALAVFLWLIVALFRTARCAPRGCIRNLWEEGLVAAYPAILIGLLVNGLVEWNFGDSEIIGLLWLLTGTLVGIETTDQFEPAGPTGSIVPGRPAE